MSKRVRIRKEEAFHSFQIKMPLRDSKIWNSNHYLDLVIMWKLSIKRRKSHKCLALKNCNGTTQRVNKEMHKAQRKGRLLQRNKKLQPSSYRECRKAPENWKRRQTRRATLV